MKTNRLRTLSILTAIATTAFALSGCAAHDDEANDGMADGSEAEEARPDETRDITAADEEDAKAVDEENVATTEQALYQYVSLSYLQTFTSPTMAFWVNTRIDIINNNSIGAYVSLQAGAGGTEYIYTPPRTVTSVWRQYWGVAVNITNVSSPVVQVKVTG